MRNWNTTALGILVLGILVTASPGWAQELTVDATQAVSKVTVDATKAAPSVVGVAVDTFQQVGPPTDFTVQGLIGWAVMFIVIGGLTYAGKRWAAYKAFTDAVGVTASRVYIKHKEGGDDSKLTSQELREAGLEMLLGMGGVVAKEAARRGPEYVMAMLHDSANAKQQAATLANR